MSRKIQLDNKKIELIKKDIERLGLHPTSAIIRHCGVSESVAMGWLRFGEKVRVTLVTVTDTKNLNPSDRYKQLTLKLHDTVTGAVTEFEAMQLTELTSSENEAVKSKNSQWLLSKKYPDRYGDHKNQTTIDDQANSLIQALININLPNPEDKKPIDTLDKFQKAFLEAIQNMEEPPKPVKWIRPIIESFKSLSEQKDSSAARLAFTLNPMLRIQRPQ